MLNVYAATKGMTVSYYSTTRMSGNPYLYRLEYLFPLIMLERQPLKHFNSHAIQYEFIAKFSDINPAFSGIEKVTFTLKIAEFALATVFVNSVKIPNL